MFSQNDPLTSTSMCLLSFAILVHRILNTQVLRDRAGLEASSRGMHSDIHVIVRFQEQSVFAGEELKCTITFKNIANLAEPITPSIARRRSSRHESISQIAAQSLKNHAHLRLSQNGRSASDKESQSDGRGRHRATASLQTPINTTDLQSSTERPGFKQRSVSIISVTSPVGNNDHPESSSSSSWARQQRLSHQRSSTTQLQHGKPLLSDCRMCSSKLTKFKCHIKEQQASSARHPQGLRRTHRKAVDAAHCRQP